MPRREWSVYMPRRNRPMGSGRRPGDSRRRRCARSTCAAGPRSPDLACPDALRRSWKLTEFLKVAADLTAAAAEQELRTVLGGGRSSGLFPVPGGRR